MNTSRVFDGFRVLGSSRHVDVWGHMNIYLWVPLCIGFDPHIYDPHIYFQSANFGGDIDFLFGAYQGQELDGVPNELKNKLLKVVAWQECDLS